MTSLVDQIGHLRSAFIQELRDILHAKDLEALKVKYLGKKGPIQALMMELKNCTPDDRPHFGKLINDLKDELVSHCESSLARLQDQKMQDDFQKEWIDSSLPGRRTF